MPRLNKEDLLYQLIRIATFPFSLLPFSWIHAIGRVLGLAAFYSMKRYRKRALSNLALAKDLQFHPKELLRTAKHSFQNLAINVLEYAKFARKKDLSRVIQCENPEIADALYKQGQGIIFFCGHQSNWEVLFLDGTSRMKGVAIGRPIKNRRLYDWIVSIRQKNGGTIITPRNAIREGMRALRQGAFLGIVGDQGMPDSGYSFPFLGRRAWTSTAPALLAYKTRSPLIFAATRRVKGGYRIHYSEPLWPNLQEPMEKEVVRLMNVLLTQLQESIQQRPGEWLWQHNRWKQQTLHILYKRFRQDCLCVILPDDPAEFHALLPHLTTLKEIYPRDFLFFLVPEAYRHHLQIDADEILTYRHPEETLLYDFRFKLIFNFTSYRSIQNHYLNLSALEVLDLATLKKLAGCEQCSLSEIFKKALCR